jgi:hypothetical protein
LPQDQHKVVKSTFEDQKRIPEQRLTRMQAPTQVVGDTIPTAQQHWGAAAAGGWMEPPTDPSTASSPAPSPGGKGKRVAGGGRKNARS